MGVELAPTIEGTVLNYRYQVEQVFNDKGGMGLIYQATDLNLRSTVVLKKSRFVDEQSRSAFEREARLLYGLRHNALPRVIDYFITEDSSQFFVMEFIPGQDLSEMLSDRIEHGEGPFPITQVLDWGDQLLDALHYLHMHNPPIIHRDIKPQNLKLMPNGQIILLDFGLAKGAVSGMTLGSASIQGYTPNYAPLEQMRGSGTDARSDIYSLAVTMHCLLSGQMPPDAVSRAIETLSAQPDPLRPLQEINPSFPAPVSEALQRACSLNQNERPGTALAMRDVLRQTRAKLSRIDSQILSELKFDTHPGSKPNPPRTASDDSPKREVNSPGERPAEKSPSRHVAEAPSVRAVVEATNATPQAVRETTPNVAGADVSAERATNLNLQTPQPQPLQPMAKAAPDAALQADSPSPIVQAQGALVNAPSAPTPFAKPVATPMAAAVAEAIPEPQAYDTVVTFTSEAPGEAEPDRQRFDTIVGFPAEAGEAVEEHQRFDTVVDFQPGHLEETEADRQRFETLVNVPESLDKEAVPALAEAVPAPVAQPAKDASSPTPAELRPTSLFVIEHKDDGKRIFEPDPSLSKGRKGPSPAPKLVQEAKPASPPAPEPANGWGQPAPRPLNANPKANQRPLIDQPTSLRREVTLEPEVEKPSQGDVLPNIDLTGVIATPNPTAVSPKGMRSYTEVIALNVRMEMHAIPGGEFLMGSPEKQGYADEYPQHRATLSPFYIGKYLITQAQWRAVMRTNPSHFNGPNHPVDSVTWDEAFEFCRRLSYATGRIYRLPTEAEWEFACRSGMQTLFNYGDEEEFIVQYAWCLTNSGNHTHPVGEKKPNGWGLYDMHGNVWEWCHDWYAADYYQHSPKVNPFGPAKGTSRVLRGGSWYSLPNYCRNAGRSNHQPDLRDPLVGFRVVCEARNT
ncbi:MAG: SUMF1/EgtB/PvdO family nonheme iron enzyme [Acidobacteria bacterium]|nr:SUMF1/EgtB/PvdO family nonheme iron enzyme [Acidobacteriota bacterium]MBI3425002.1 SUMF1/EgtB/PvdO family nonheme iron enzyme [Acidobacteriota bacterium]